MSYPIHITNIYELLGEEGEAPKVIPSKDAKQAPKTAPTKSAQNAKSGNAPVKTTQKDTQRKNDRSADQSRGKGENRPRFDRTPRSSNTGAFEEAPNREKRERREGSGNRGEERARIANVAGGFVGNRRVYDRKSGTGRGREQKKGGSGRGNWGREGEGSEQTTEDAVAEEAQEAKEVIPKEETAEEKESRQQREEEERKEKEEREKEEKLMTLEDYLKNKKQPAFALPEARKANEGTDNKEWGGYVVLKKEEETSASASKDDKKAKKSKESQHVPVDQVFDVKESPRPRDDDRGSRGRRGGGRGGRGGSSGRGRGGRKSGEPIPKFDESSFPTLAPKA